MGDKIANLTLIDAKELSDYLKEVHGIEPAAGPTMLVPPEDFGPKDEEEARTEFNVVLDGFGASKKISVIKVVRAETGLGLKEAKNAVEAAPTTIKEAVSKDEAERLVALLCEAGGEAKLV